MKCDFPLTFRNQKSVNFILAKEKTYLFYHPNLPFQTFHQYLCAQQCFCTLNMARLQLIA